jgi:hypothetical protein
MKVAVRASLGVAWYGRRAAVVGAGRGSLPSKALKGATVIEEVEVESRLRKGPSINHRRTGSGSFLARRPRRGGCE